MSEILKTTTTNRIFTRIAATQAIYCLKFRNDLDEVIKQFCEGDILQAGKSKEYSKIDQELFKTLVLNSRKWSKDNQKLISKYINSDWTLDRLAVIDLAILECAITEAKSIQTPTGILISEHVNTAKSFHTDYRFINGLLHNATKALDPSINNQIDIKKSSYNQIDDKIV